MKVNCCTVTMALTKHALTYNERAAKREFANNNLIAASDYRIDKAWSPFYAVPFFYVNNKHWPTPHCNSLRQQKEIRIAFQLNELNSGAEIGLMKDALSLSISFALCLTLFWCVKFLFCKPEMQQSCSSTFVCDTKSCKIISKGKEKLRWRHFSRQFNKLINCRVLRYQLNIFVFCFVFVEASKFRR